MDISSDEPRWEVQQVIRVSLAGSEWLPTEGDRMPKSDKRRKARVIGYFIRFVSRDGGGWVLDRYGTSMSVQQQRADGSWSDSQAKRIPFGRQAAIENEFYPDWTPTLGRES